MEYETIKGCGKLGIEFGRIGGKGSRVTRDFLHNLLPIVVKRSKQYYVKTGDHVFTYSERQLHSVVCPSIAEITNAYIIEHPITRKPIREKEYRGNVDYWISHNKFSFLMELKHTYFTYNRLDSPRRSIARKFLDATRQLMRIKKDECEDPYLLAGNKGLIKMALEVVVFRRGTRNPNQNLEDDLRLDFKDLFDRMLDNTGLWKKTNFRALWLLHENLVEPFEYESTYGIKKVIFPAVAFIGKLFPIISIAP